MASFDFLDGFFNIIISIIYKGKNRDEGEKKKKGI